MGMEIDDYHTGPAVCTIYGKRHGSTFDCGSDATHGNPQRLGEMSDPHGAVLAQLLDDLGSYFCPDGLFPIAL
jgi:hypothetical protein